MTVFLFGPLLYHCLQAHPSPKACQSHKSANNGGDTHNCGKHGTIDAVNNSGRSKIMVANRISLPVHKWRHEAQNRDIVSTDIEPFLGNRLPKSCADEK